MLHFRVSVNLFDKRNDLMITHNIKNWPLIFLDVLHVLHVYTAIQNVKKQLTIVQLTGFGQANKMCGGFEYFHEHSTVPVTLDKRQ